MLISSICAASICATANSHFAASGEKRKKSFALRGGELLGIVQAFEFARQTGFRPFRRQNGRRRHDRPGQRPAPGLVHARDAGQALRHSARSNSKRSESLADMKRILKLILFFFCPVN